LLKILNLKNGPKYGHKVKQAIRGRKNTWINGEKRQMKPSKKQAIRSRKL
jgi:macrodomain Ter protein organizer (MatP/YcbG family)